MWLPARRTELVLIGTHLALSGATAMNTILIVYATREGQTQKIAERIATDIRAQGHAAELVDAEVAKPALDLARYDAIVVGAPIHAGGYPRSIVRFVREHRSVLEHLQSAFFSVGLAVASRTTDGIAETQPLIDAFIEKTGWRPAHVELIAGALPYSKYNLFIRIVMKRIAKSAGGDTDTSKDYEYTNWDEVDRFANDVVKGTDPGTRSA